MKRRFLNYIGELYGIKRRLLGLEPNFLYKKRLFKSILEFTKQYSPPEKL